MPKRIRTRNTQGLYISASLTGHKTAEGKYIDSLIQATALFTTSRIVDSIASIDFVEEEKLPVLPELTDEQTSILKHRGVINTSNNSNSYSSTINSYSNAFVAVEQSIQDIQTSVTTVIQETVVEYECESNGDYYGLKKSEAKEFYENFVQAYVSKGPIYLPSLDEFHRFYTLIEDAKGSKPEDFRLDMYKDTLTVLVQSRGIYLENIKLNTEICSLRNYKDQAKAKITELMKEINNLTGENQGSYFSGKLGIKLKKPKRLIYAQALLNINMAWYIYLHNTSKIKPEEFMSTVAYVNHLGNDAYDTLIKLLDEKYACLDDLMEEIEDNLQISSAEETSSCSNKSSSQNNTDGESVANSAPTDTESHAGSGGDTGSMSGSGCCDTASVCGSAGNDTDSICGSIHNTNPCNTSDSELYSSDDDCYNECYQPWPIEYVNIGGIKALALPGALSVTHNTKVKNTQVGKVKKVTRQTYKAPKQRPKKSCKKKDKPSCNKTCKQPQDKRYAMQCSYVYIGNGIRALKLNGSINVVKSEKISNKTRKCCFITN